MELLFALALDGVTQSTVDLPHLVIKLAHHDLLLLRRHLFLGLPLETFHDSLGLFYVSSTCHLGTLHHTVLLQHVRVDVQVELLALA